MAGEGVAHLRVWLTTGPEPGHLAVVTETGLTALYVPKIASTALNSRVARPALRP